MPDTDDKSDLEYMNWRLTVKDGGTPTIVVYATMEHQITDAFKQLIGYIARGATIDVAFIGKRCPDHLR